MVKRLLFFTLALFFIQVSEVFSQITGVTVDPGPYTPGSSIAATFSLGSDCIAANNTFELYLSDATGSFVGETRIGTYASFYGTFVNGTIPPATTPGSNYRVRVKSTAIPTLISGPSVAFTISAGAIVNAKLTSASTISTGSMPVTFGSCDTDPAQSSTPFIFNNESSTANVTVTIINELDPGAPSNMTFTSINEAKVFMASLAHYTMIVKATANGTVGTTAYFLVNNLAVTAFTTISGNTVCFPVGAFEYLVNTGRNGGIKDNFPGNTYSVTWGDGSTNIYTYCQIINQNSKVGHTFTRSSCGLTYTSGTETTYNAFGINVGVVSPFCGKVGSPLSTAARVVSRPENIISAPPVACLGNVTFVNNSTAGERPNSNAPGCTSNTVLYTWNVDGVDVAVNVPFSNYTHLFTTKGSHTIRLTSISNGTCQADPTEITICIQDPPKPIFTLPTNKICLTPGVLTPDNTSILDNTCPGASPVYTWVVSPSTGVTYVGGTNANSPVPQFKFTQIGTYNITLNIRSATCQATTIAQQVVVDSEPQATLSTDVHLCQIGQFTFSPSATITNTVISGNAVDLPDTYTWEVSGGTYNFVPGSTINSKYPTINFTEYKEYTIKLTYQNACNTIVRTQKITFSEAPVPTITAIPDPICYNDVINLTGAIANRTLQTTFQWAGSPGGVFSNPNDLNTTYTPTAAEQNAGNANIRLIVNTGLTGNCAQVIAQINVTITPENVSTNPIPSRTVISCTGNPVSFTPTSVVQGSTFTWTATNPDGNANGFSLSGNGIINNTINNTSTTDDAVVVYTITPATTACIGVAFTFTVIVKPKPIISASAAQSEICSGSSVGITMSSNIAPTTYTWVSTVISGSITSNPPVTTPSSSQQITETLINTGITTGQVKYTITPYSSGNCPGAPVEVIINVNPPLPLANAGPDESICAKTSYTFNATPTTFGTGEWTLVSPSTAAVTFDNINSPTAKVSGLTFDEVYTFRWTVTAPGVCTTPPDDVIITVNNPTIPGTTSSTNALVCQENNTGTITLSGQVGTILRWERLAENETIWTTIPGNNTGTTYTFNNLPVTTQFRAVVQNSGCTIEFSTPTTITVAPATTTAIAGPDQPLCNQPTTHLDAGNLILKPGETAIWTMVSGAPNAIIVDPANPKSEITGLAPNQTYVFRWTITGNSPCDPKFDEVTIRNNPPIDLNTITSSSTVCNGKEVIIVGSTPIGGDGSQYTYAWETKTGTGSWAVIPGATTKDLTITLITTGQVSFRRIVTSGCALTSNEFTIDVLPPIAGNIISADQTICSGLIPDIITGGALSGGGGGYIYHWQSSTDGTTWTDIPTAAGADYQPPALTESTFYRRIVRTSECDGTLQNISLSIKKTVSPNAKAEFNYLSLTGCAPFSPVINTVPYPDRNATYTWYVNNVVLPSTGSDFPGYEISTSNTIVNIKLVVTSSLGCATHEFSRDFSTIQAVPASFTLSETSICGPKAVTFTNTSLQGAGATFRWKVGNTQISTNANPAPYTFQPDPTGKDTTYTVTLYSETICGPDSAKATVLVKAPPKAIFSPQKTIGCSPLLVVFTNNSPNQSGVEYFYDYGDGTNSGWVGNRNNISHTYLATTKIETYKVKMTARSECGDEVSGIYDIVVSPKTVSAELVVSGSQKIGCAPLRVDFDNNSTGATQFLIDFKDGFGLRSLAASPKIFQYEFKEGGVYNVMLIAKNDCTADTTYERITVHAQPKPMFEANVTLGCPNLPVTFKNTTQGNDITSYLWDFGDGSQFIGFEPPIHIFSGDKETYTVTLTATNALNCPNTQTLTIRIVQPPVAAFNVNPSTLITIPDYTFNFEDQSTNNPTIWEWNFGDKSEGSKLKNPSHTYLDTGTYKVTLKVLNQQGCYTTTFKNVTIKGVPGYLFVPNSFIPGDTRPELRDFHAKGSGINSWRFSVFNKWGQILWETTKLEEGRPVEGWDGTFKGQPMPQGVYYWKIDVQMVNGTEWKGMTYDKSAPKRTGAIHLIR